MIHLWVKDASFFVFGPKKFGRKKVRNKFDFPKIRLIEKDYPTVTGKIQPPENISGGFHLDAQEV